MLVMILEIFIIIIGVMWISGVIYLISGGRIFNRFFHNVMGWHIPDYEKPLEIDGFDNIYAHCKVCGKEIMRDSRKVSNWELK